MTADVIWHDLECGGYREDLPLWRSLARECEGPVLELGCGTGRVALDLASQGHAVTAVDSDPELVAALLDRARARSLEVDARVGDARALDLEAGFALVAIPMQMLQLLPGTADRARVLASAAACLAGGGLIAASIVEGVPEGGGELAQPLPDVAEADGWVYSSLPLEIADHGESMLVTRLRQTVSPGGDLSDHVDETRLAVLRPGQLEGEARDAGLLPVGRREVPSTDWHVGSTVVLLGRA